MHRNIAQLSFNMVKTKRFILAKHFVGEPKESDLQLVEEDLPALKDRGNFSVECAVIFSVNGTL
jgi:hypothetical protein